MTLFIGCETTDAGRKFEEVLVPLVYELNETGWNVKVVSARFSQTITSWYRVAYNFRYDITRAEWETKIRTTAHSYVSIPVI
ncbi:hypothetical protein HBI37_153330 [Parastagonospora nodorum]|nr:hypothetical protein HBI37_153330 [Parastagonospora nodorum]